MPFSPPLLSGDQDDLFSSQGTHRGLEPRIIEEVVKTMRAAPGGKISVALVVLARKAAARGWFV